MSCSKQNSASLNFASPFLVQLHYRNNSVNNSSRRKVILQRKKVQKKRANESSEQGVGPIHVRGKEESNQKNHPTEAKGEVSRKKV